MNLRSSNSGYTLLELLAAFTVMLIALNLCAGVVMKNTRLSAATTRALDSVNQLTEIEREFTQSVRESCGIVPAAGDYKTGKGRVVLRMTGEDGTERYAVWGRLRQKDRISVLVLARKADTFDVERFVTYPLPVRRAEFRFNAAAPEKTRLVRLDLVIKDEGRDRPHYWVAAAPRGVQP